MLHIIQAALEEVRDGFSVDVVIADPDINKRFIGLCALRGLKKSPYDLNRLLLNARKSEKLGALNCERKPSIRNPEGYRFASEIAVRHIERRHKVSLDRILCDPDIADELDRVAASISPGYKPLEYRWAALGLRKRRKLQPELATRMIELADVIRNRAADLDVSLIPRRPGVYMFHEISSMLYIGETENLRKRLKKHLKHSDNLGLARWIWQHGNGDLYVECLVLPRNTTPLQRKAVESSLIATNRPLFNTPR